jgi:heme ABC exporter ATP-binding subunit CcmA
VIAVRGLAKSFGTHAALRGIDLDVAEGECLALVGPNGAGKTTLLRILATLSKPSAGSVRIAGVDLADGARDVRRQVGFLSHQPLLYEDLSGEENLHFYGRMYDVTGLEARITDMFEQVGLSASRHDPVRTYSRGMKQRLAIARAFLHDPPVLLFDEPYTGLDRQAAAMLDTVLHQVGMGSRTAIVTTHNLERGLSVSDRAVLLVRGQIAGQMDDRVRDLERFRHIYETQAAGSAR